MKRLIDRYASLQREKKPSFEEFRYRLERVGEYLAKSVRSTELADEIAVHAANKIRSFAGDVGVTSYSDNLLHIYTVRYILRKQARKATDAS